MSVRVPLERPRARAKYLWRGDRKFLVRGVTYGPFRPGSDGVPYPDAATVRDDFARMVACGINSIRTYTVPPRRLLDEAAASGLAVLVGIPWEQHVAFLDDRARARRIEERVAAEVRSLRGHRALLGWAVGNEIPSAMVRWHGPRRVARFLERLVAIARAEDPAALVTYVNFPTTEYLDLPFLDLVCFNVYLESSDRYQAYLARLQNIAGDRPLLLTEIGLDARHHGDEAQARTVDQQVRAAFAQGAAGAFVFAWSDDWHRGGEDVRDWEFGLTTRARRPRPALDVLARAYDEVPFARGGAPRPFVSVVVCTHNGARTLGECLEGLARLEYPAHEVIVVDDGSSDGSAALAASAKTRLIRIPHGGLSQARNVGFRAAEGEIVAYIDDDAHPDPDWLTHLAHTFATTDHAGVGGPNVPPPGDGMVADAVACAPGGPIHVLLTDTVAEHIPGCNMAFRKGALEAIGGFDPVFRAAGDDVDLCWRLQERGLTIGFNPAAMVWHHRRGSVRAYVRQQRGYGRAEALLERKWPQRFNALGHLSWSGRLYGGGIAVALLGRRPAIYQGTFGLAPFQSVYERSAGTLAALTLMPEWYAVVAALGLTALLGLEWRPALAAAPAFALAASASLVQAFLSARRAARARPMSGHPRARLALATLLHLVQPAARLRGRLAHGLAPWRRRGGDAGTAPVARSLAAWSESWRAPVEWLEGVERALRDQGSILRRGGDYDDWDIEVRGGVLAGARLRMVVEQHERGRQLARFRIWPRWSVAGVAAALVAGGLGAGAWSDGAVLAGTLFSALAAVLGISALREASRAIAGLESALRGEPWKTGRD